VDRRTCDYTRCQRPALPYGFVYGRAYCEEHYLLGLKHALLKELPSVVAGNPSTKFRNLFGRYVEGVYSARDETMPEALAGNKLRDRAENIQYRENAITFTIKRHPQPIPIQQHWRFDLEDKIFTLIKEEPTLLDCSEAADILGKTAQTVRRYIKEGRIGAQRASETTQITDWFEDKLGRGDYDTWVWRNRIIRADKWLIPREEIIRFMNEH